MTALDVRHNGTVQAQPAAALAIRPGQTMWDEAQTAALNQLGLAEASDGDRAVFLHQCQRTGLDPFARQIYMIARPERVPGTQNQWRKKWTIQTGIDGFRVNRARAERQAGVRGILGRAIWYDHEGNEFKVWVRRDAPAACEITYTVIDANGETPYTSVLQFAEYVQLKDGKPIAQWATKGSHMLEKCTEADVYRKAFPQDFAGVSLDDAMPPADDIPAAPAGRVTAADIRGRTRPLARAEIVRDTPIDASPAEPQTPAADTAGEAQHEQEAPPPARATGGQVGILQSLWRGLGYDDSDPAQREERLTFTARLAGLDELATTSDLTQDQATHVREQLKPCKTRADVVELITGGGNGN